MANNRRYRNRKPQKVDYYNPPFSEEVLTQSIDILDLRENTRALLDSAHISTIKDVVKRGDKDFYKISTFNKKNLLDVIRALKVKKLFLKPTEEANSIENKKPDAQDSAKGPQTTNGNVRQDRRQETHPNNSKRAKDTLPPYVETTKIVRPPKVVNKIVREDPDIYLKVNKNGKWGFKDREGKQVIDTIYDEVFSYKEELCCVQKDELFGFIDRNGAEVIPMVYSCATSFSEGLACVFKGEKCGYINTKNEIVVSFNFDAGTPVVDGECRVKKEGRWGELHINAPLKDALDDAIPSEIGIENIRWII